MNYFMKKENVAQYKNMIEDYDPMPIIEKLGKYISNGDSVLELGMGTGVDFEFLSKNYTVTGSDNSPVFIEDYKKNHPNANVILLDARNITISEKFNCIFSNKVLQHLTREDFKVSLLEQKKVLKPDGIVFMTLWRGEYREELMFNDELRFTYYLESDIEDMVRDLYEIVSIERYEEMEKSDSMIVVLKNTDKK